MAISNIRAVFRCDIKKVWDTVTSLENYQWRSDLGRIEVLSDTRTEIDFTENVVAKKLFMKPFVKAFLKKQQKQYVSDLEKALQ